MATQQQWQFEITTGAGVFTELEGLKEFPEFSPQPRTLRSVNYINVARTQQTKPFEFNRQFEGNELALSVVHMPHEPAQAALVAAVGNNEGLDVRLSIFGEQETEVYTFNVLVMMQTLVPASTEDETGVEMSNFTLKVNNDVVKVVTPAAGA